MQTYQPNKCFVTLKKLTGHPWSEKKSGEIFFKVRTLSGNSVISQGIFELSIKSGKSQSGNFEIKSQGILKCMVKT